MHYRSCRKRHLTTAHGLAGLATGTYIPFLHEYRHLDGTGASIVCRTYTSYILFSLSIPVSFCILCILPPRSHSHALSKRLFSFRLYIYKYYICIYGAYHTRRFRVFLNSYGYKTYVVYMCTL